MKLNRTLTGSSLAIVALTASAVLATPAVSAPTGTSAALVATGSDTSKLAAQLGAKSAGIFLDAQGRTTVAVTTAAAAAEVRKAGAIPKMVTRSAAQLATATATLKSTATVPGSAWAVDPETNQVLVSVDSSVKGAALAKVKKAVSKLGAAARLETVPGTFKPLVSGGGAVYSSGYRCSLGFNVRSGSTYYFLTAGHCTDVGATWYSNSGQTTLLGSRAGTSFPGNDYGIVQYSSSASTPPGNVTLYNGSTQDITSSGTPAVNQTVNRSGSTTGLKSGTVTQLNATVNYAEGSVSGLIRTTVCAEGGDSGGSLFAGTVAYGLTSGGSGDCTSGGVTYFQPVAEALSAYGVSVY